MMIWQRLGLRGGLYLGLCGTFIVIARTALTRGVFLAVADSMAGMEMSLMLQQVLINSSMNMAFGAAGGLLVPRWSSVCKARA